MSRFFASFKKVGAEDETLTVHSRPHSVSQTKRQSQYCLLVNVEVANYLGNEFSPAQSKTLASHLQIYLNLNPM